MSALFLVLGARGQETKPVEKGKLQIGIFAMPSLAFDHESKQDIDFVIAKGVKIEKKISGRLTLGSGITYYNVELYQGNWHGGICASPMNYCRWTTNRTYLEVPLALKINYSLEKRTVDPYLNVGIITAFTVKERDRRVDEYKDHYTSETFKQDGLKYRQNYLAISFGTAFNVSDHFNFYLEPTFKYWFITDFNPTIMVGLAAGMNYRLK